jgi:hypothetical protein
MRSRKADGHRAAIKRRNPMARALRDPLFRAQRQASRKRYSRKEKHKHGRGDGVSEERS